uniref:Uncharacterized protein n=1 Tax=Cyclophora tenuis TaxID=216820 RepID=A0A7S1CXY3_CYCTE
MSSVLQRWFGGKKETDDSPPPLDDKLQTPCQLECRMEQSELAKCMETVRQNGDTTCMSSAIEAWTTCCADANLRATTNTNTKEDPQN